jgi:hypothetical protein
MFFLLAAPFVCFHGYSSQPTNQPTFMGRSTALEWVSRLADTANQQTPANLRASSDAGQLLALLDGIGEVLQCSG